MRKLFPDCFLVGGNNKRTGAGAMDAQVSDAQIDWYRFVGIRPPSETDATSSDALADSDVDANACREPSKLEQAIADSINVARPPLDATNPVTVGWDLVAHMVTRAVIAFKFTKTTVFVLRFDKAGCVPACKDGVRLKRARSASKVPPFEWDGKSPIVEIDRPLPSWASLNANRRARNHALGELCQLILQHFRPKFVGRTFMVDGHTPRNTHPIAIQYIGEPSGFLINPTDDTFANHVGEADHALVFFAHKFVTERNMSVITRSIDNDIMWLDILHAGSHWRKRVLHCCGMRYFRRRQEAEAAEAAEEEEEEEITLTQARALPRHQVRYAEEYIDINRLHSAIAEHLRPQGLTLPVHSFVICASAAVSDYVANFPGIIVDRFIEAIWKHAKYIGDLLAYCKETKGFTLDHEAYLRLIEVVYAIRYTGAPEILTRCSSKAHVEAQRNELRQEVANRNKSPKRATWRIPSDDDLSQRYLQTMWYMLYMLYGPLQPERIPDPCTMGFKNYQLADGRIVCVPANFTDPAEDDE